MTHESVDKRQVDFRQALLNGDAAVLEDMLLEECRIIGPKGFFIGRSEWIATHQETDYTQIRLDSREVAGWVSGDTAIRWEMQDSCCLYKGESFDGVFRVTQVWVRQPDAWRLTALQYTPVSAP